MLNNKIDSLLEKFTSVRLLVAVCQQCKHVASSRDELIPLFYCSISVLPITDTEYLMRSLHIVE